MGLRDTTISSKFVSPISFDVHAPPSSSSSLPHLSLLVIPTPSYFPSQSSHPHLSLLCLGILSSSPEDHPRRFSLCVDTDLLLPTVSTPYHTQLSDPLKTFHYVTTALLCVETHVHRENSIFDVSPYPLYTCLYIVHSFLFSFF